MSRGFPEEFLVGLTKPTMKNWQVNKQQEMETVKDKTQPGQSNRNMLLYGAR
jgi:hypothetical protein